MVRGAPEVEQVVTCVFPSDEIVARLPPRTFLFSEHPLDFGEVTLFKPLSRTAFERMRAAAISFYHVHAPLDMHPEVSPSRLVATGLGLHDLEEYGPIAEGSRAAPASSARALGRWTSSPGAWRRWLVRRFRLRS